ncbi:hypothetical protein ACM16X_02300 [Haloarcula japonica]|uniref:hypothetical protein n=1 Tax=Haloarcula japonica TaxID=29282 RepID=UPI0039F68B6D
MVLLHDGDYRFPKDVEVEKSWSIIEEQAEDYDHEVQDSTMPYFSIDTGDGLRYDLLYTKPEEGVKAVAVYDEERDELQDFYEIEELLPE